MPNKDNIQINKADLVASKLNRLYLSIIQDISGSAKSLKLKDGVPFNISDYPYFERRVNETLKDLTNKSVGVINQATEEQWLEAYQKNMQITTPYLNRKLLSEAQIKAYTNKNLEALASFQKRKINGLKLSDRVWKYSNQYKGEIEMSIDVALKEGMSASKLSREVRSYLQEPEKLFRRVRDKHGNLHLSKMAQKYSPGGGVYRSSYKNAMRLARTEVNMAYRASDYEKYRQLDFVTGFEVKRSNRVFGCSVCEGLKGKYPKTFKFVGWHPQCRCYTVPILNKVDDFLKQQEAILKGENPAPTEAIEVLPGNFKYWYGDNKERIDRAKSLPYFIRDNKLLINTTNTLDEIKRRNISTQDYYLVKGKYTKERQELHESIVNRLMNEVSHSKTKTNYFLGGATANGKSTLVKSGNLPHPKGILTVDSDSIKGLIPEYQMLVKKGDLNAANIVHEESSDISKKLISVAKANNKDFILDGVNDGNYEKLLNKIKSNRPLNGRLRADYVSLDTDLSVKLAEARAIKTGREVPLTYIREVNKEVSVIIPKLIKDKAFDELYLWDTNINGKARLILKQIDGKLTVVNQKLYDNFLLKAQK